MGASPQSRSKLSPSPGRIVSRAGRFWSWGLLAVVLLTMAFIRARLLNFPLERDEGEYAYAGQLILHGVPPYQECYNMKWPGTYMAYAAIMGVFGQTTAGIHLGLLCVSLASALLVFLIGRRIGGEGMGAVAAATQALLAMNPSTLGLAAHATHFVVFAALAGIWVLMVPWAKIGLRRCVAVGLFFGLACMMKQAGAVFGVFAVLWLVWRGLTEQRGGMRDLKGAARRIGFVAAGGLLPLLSMAGVLAAAGVFGKFWHWTVEYARAYVGILTFSQGLVEFGNRGHKLWAAAPGLWLMAAAGLALLWWEPAMRKWRFFLVMFALFSFAGVCPGFYFREHYFLLLLPAAGLLCGAAWCAVASWTERFLCWVVRQPGMGDAALLDSVPRPGFGKAARGISGGLFVLAAVQSLMISGDVFFRLTPVQACRRVYGANPFPESVEVAQYIDQHCRADSRVAVVGSEPQIYFYSHRRAATGYIYTYPLMETQPFALEMQQEMIREIERAAPEYLVYVSVPTSWLAHPGSDRTLFKWVERYTEDQMQLVGLVELFPGNSPKSYWNLAGNGIRPSTDYWLTIFRKKQTLASHAPL